MTQLSVLIIEDNHSLAEQIYGFLEQQGLVVDFSHTGMGGLELLQQNHFDVVVLDVMLPDISGLEVCRRIKIELLTDIPVLMLTSLDGLDDKREGFSSGADDYLAKPFVLEELLMRCRALARRRSLHESHIIDIEDLRLDVRSHCAYRQGQELKLNRIGFKILQILATAYPQAVSRSQLIRQLWGDDAPESDSLRSHIYSLRNILDKPYKDAILHTVHGVGFILRVTK